MPYKSKEQLREYKKEWRQENKERLSEYNKEYYQSNKERVIEQSKKYYQDNKQYIKERSREYEKEYRKTENGKKCNRIVNWKQRGVICDDWDALYDKYINTANCENCDVELIEGLHGNNRRCLNHCHETGLFRAVLCHKCNIQVFRNI